MPIENRVRVEIFLPLRSDSAAYQIVTDWLAEEFAFTRGGSTITTPFAGLYTSASQSFLVQDAIRVLFCDFDADLTNHEQAKEFVAYLETIRRLMLETLQEEEVWIIYYPISRITG